MTKPLEIPTYAINLSRRTERKRSLLNQFEGKMEFKLNVIPAVEHRVGSFGLWQSIYGIIQKANELSLDYVLICEDDHIFTKDYSAQKLYMAIDQSLAMDADILLGGVSWFNRVLQINPQLFWVDRFNGTQFMLVFKRFYQQMLEINFLMTDIADMKTSAVTDRIFVMYPFVSIQKEFGYSDITTKSESERNVAELFDNRNEKLMHLDKVSEYYGLFKFGRPDGSKQE